VLNAAPEEGLPDGDGLQDHGPLRLRHLRGAGRAQGGPRGTDVGEEIGLSGSLYQ